MNALTPTSVVHYFDTRTHGILCGVHGADHRSTKHSRSVTCHACVGLLRERPAMPAAPAQPDASGAAR
jgi:hypothetical protein